MNNIRTNALAAALALATLLATGYLVDAPRPASPAPAAATPEIKTETAEGKTSP